MLIIGENKMIPNAITMKPLIISSKSNDLQKLPGKKTKWKNWLFSNSNAENACLFLEVLPSYPDMYYYILQQIEKNESLK